MLYLQQAEVTRERVYAMHQSSIDGVEDMSALAELHEAAIMHNLYQRYQKDSIYVSAFRWTLVCVYVCVRLCMYVEKCVSTLCYVLMCLPPPFPLIFASKKLLVGSTNHRMRQICSKWRRCRERRES